MKSKDKGAHFYRCDFQVHTPRDSMWSGKESVDESSRKEFADSLIRSCRTKGLDAIAISDHHDLVMYPFVRQSAKSELDDQGQPIPEDQQIVVFPAIELTLGLPCQAIIIFDANIPFEFISIIPTALGISTTSANESKIQSPIQKVDHFMNLTSVYEQLNRNESLRGKFIVFPNVTDGGHKTLLRSGFDSHYREMPCVGGYLDGSIDKLGNGSKTIIDGKNRDYGFKPIAVIQTSDSRSADFKNLGIYSSWIKWATPTAEALRQACLAKESRISQIQPTTPQVHITGLHVSNSKFMGPIDLFLNPQYTAFIGGRGTGKSTILEYLRWGLCDQPSVIDDDVELPDYQKRRSSLIEKTLKELNSTVDVHFSLNDVSHVVRRTAKGEISLKIGASEFRTSSEDEIRSLLPVHAYSQKQLSNVGIRVEELNRFIRRPIKRDLDEIESEVKKIGTVIKRTYEAKAASEQAATEKSQLETESTSLTEQIRMLRESLKGLSEEDQEVLTKQATFEHENSFVEIWKNEISSAEENFSKLSESLLNLPTNPEEGESDFLNSTNAQFAKVIEETKSSLSTVSANFKKQIELSVIKSIESWEKLKQVHSLKCTDVQGRSQADQTALGQISSLEQRLKQLQTNIAERTSRIKKYEPELSQFEVAVSEYFILLGKQNELLSKQCQHLSSLSKGYIKAELQEAASLEGAPKTLKDLAKGTQIRSNKIDGLFEKISKTAKPLDAWKNVLFDLEKLARLQATDLDKVVLPTTPSLDEHEFNETEKLKLVSKLNSSTWVGLLLSPLNSVPIFKYRSRENEYIDFNDASAGQQATALMYVLLNQSGPPLLIDQPEDDLDSNVIGQICSEIWSSKGRRQLIFTSHNANLVVNGDADLVVACDYRIAGDQSGGKIAKEGAIDIDDVRKEITKVMEGGEKAFGLRRQKYGF